jgi:hypothetical protein
MTLFKVVLTDSFTGIKPYEYLLHEDDRCFIKPILLTMTPDKTDQGLPWIMLVYYDIRSIDFLRSTRCLDEIRVSKDGTQFSVYSNSNKHWIIFDWDSFRWVKNVNVHDIDEKILDDIKELIKIRIKTTNTCSADLKYAVKGTISFCTSFAELDDFRNQFK